MTIPGTHDEWSGSIEKLNRWHAHADRGALEGAIRFLADELPRLLSPRLANKLGRETVRDLVQDFLADLQAKPLPTAPEHPRTYLGRALQNRALSLLRRKDAEPVAVVPEPPQEQTAAAQERLAAAREVLRALQSLAIEDRVALKLSEAPEALDAEELDWLAARVGITREDARTRALRAERTEERVRLFDGASGPLGASDLGRAVDRFHKRVSRARERLTRLGGDR